MTYKVPKLANMQREERRWYVELLIAFAVAAIDRCPDSPYSANELARSFHRLLGDGLAELWELPDGRINMRPTPKAIGALH